ncbi:hypothetical protein G7046_g8420 [Stylonectria norvegica]|nr:hypothetical protein G7046_g8420 [Stylonectria norvegica]
MKSWLTRWPLAAALLLLQYTVALRGDKNKGSGFTYPAEKGLTFYEKDSVNVSWATNFKSASLLVFCWEEGKEGILAQKKRWDNVPGNNGSQIVFVDFNTTASTCWFNLRDRDKDAQDSGINSAGFALSSMERSQTTLGLQGPATTTLAVTATRRPATMTIATESPTFIKEGSPTSTEAKATATTGNYVKNSSSVGRLSTGAKAGIGAAVGVGVLGLAALATSFYVVKRRKTKVNNSWGSAVEKDGDTLRGYRDRRVHELPSLVPGAAMSIGESRGNTPQELPG